MFGHVYTHTHTVTQEQLIGFDTGEIYEELLSQFNFSLNWTNIMDEDVQDFVYTFSVYIGIVIITREEEEKFFIVFRLPWRFFPPIF